MAERCRRLIQSSSVRPLLAVAAIIVPALAAVAIVLAPAPGVGDEAATAQAAAGTKRAPRAKTLTIGWVGDVTPGSQYGLPGDGGRALFANVRTALREPDIMLANLEGTLSVGGASKCPVAAANCFAFQAPPTNARALHDAGIDLVNLANNHSFDYGAAGRAQTLRALTDGHVAFTGLQGDVRVLTRKGIRVGFVGFSTYRWTPSMDDPQAIHALIDRAKAIADVVVVLFHAGAEGSDRTAVPLGREFAFGEDRGDSRAFAHLAIDRGADLVLGSGPHVVRGMETYKGRLIAYSLGNFAGAGNFASGGTLSVSGMLSVRVDRRGRMRNGWWRGMTLDGSGAPRPDAGTSRALVAQLSARDFGPAAPRVLTSGRILPVSGPGR
jgi:hypothetical protein